MRFSVDPWDPSYGVSLDAAEAQSRQEVDAGVEVPIAQWAPLDPGRAEVPPAVLFVDGVRRVDAQAWIHEADGPDALPALYASYAAGVICCCARDGAHLAAYRVERRLVSTAEHAVDVATGAGTYVADVIEAAKPNQPPGQALSQRVQGLLHEVEVTVAGQARDRLTVDDDLLVVDGPLRGCERLPRAVGYIKTHHTPYLRDQGETHAVVAALGSGQRTPLFKLTSSDGKSGYSRYTWYLRLPCPPGAPWAGIVRLECSAHLAVAAAVALAGRTQVTLARYASAGYKDSRSPQNLYPIAGLERALRRRLGDAGVLYRALRAAAGRPTDPAAGRPTDPAAGRPVDPAAGRPETAASAAAGHVGPSRTALDALDAPNATFAPSARARAS
jgi:hypothetical protein